MKKTLLFLLATLHLNFAFNQNKSDNYNDTITVALYPYVPRINQFKDVLKEMWRIKNPTCYIKFVDWDCYSGTPNDSLDIFVFDNIFMSEYIANGLLLEIPKEKINKFDDFLPYSLLGVKDSINGRKYYGIPQIGCTNMLFYQKNDLQLANAKGITEICDIIGPNDPTIIIPKPKQGLLIDLSGSTTDACLYVDISIDNCEPYSWNPKLPSYCNLDDKVLKRMRQLVTASGASLAIVNKDTSYLRAVWFNKGLGRAMVNFTEAMSVMDTKTLEQIDFKIMPYSDEKGNNLMYNDVIGIASSLECKENKKVLALEMANLLASEEFIIGSFKNREDEEAPQYLMPVRHSVFKHLSKDLPMYAKMYDIILKAEPQAVPFRLGTNARTWLKLNKKIIKQKVFEEAVR